MEKEVISERQGIVLFILFLIGSTFLIGTGGQAKQDSWISIIIAVAGSSVILLLYSKILSHYPGKDLFDILQIVFGKYIGKFLCIFMIWFAFHDGTLVTRNLSEFTNVHVLPDTPVVVPMLFFIALCIWGVKEGIEVLGRWSEFFVIIVISTFLFITILSITQMDIDRLKPILDNGFTPILKGAFSAFSFPFGETVVFTMVFSNINKGGNYNKVFIVGLLIGGLLIFIAVSRNILVLGAEELSNTYFPSYSAVSLIHIGEPLQRLEMTVTIVFIVCVFIKVNMCLLAVSKGIVKVFGFNDYRFIVTPVALLMLEFSFFIYKNTMEMTDWAFKAWPYYSLLFEVIIPLIIFIAVEVKGKKKSSKKVAAQ
jgi:spore germination protein KB